LFCKYGLIFSFIFKAQLKSTLNKSTIILTILIKKLNFKKQTSIKDIAVAKSLKILAKFKFNLLKVSSKLLEILCISLKLKGSILDFITLKNKKNSSKYNITKKI
jgi:hypothetical protein